MKARDFDLIALVVKELPIDEKDSEPAKARSLLGTAFADALEAKYKGFDRDRFFRLANTVDWWKDATETGAAIKRMRAVLKRMDMNKVEWKPKPQSVSTMFFPVKKVRTLTAAEMKRQGKHV